MVGFAIVAKTGAMAGGAEPGSEARAIFAAKCLKCHGPEKQKGGLRFDSRDGLLGKGDSGSPAVLPGKPGESEMMRRLTATDDTERMPPGNAGLTPDQIDTIRKWIETGAEWPRELTGSAGVRRTQLTVTEEDRQHWAFRPLAKIEPPADRQNATNEIDRFMLAALEAKLLTPARPADARVLIRRITFDLTGLPPTPEEVETFVASTDREAAYEKLVDRLLASPHFGERWGRHWLDVARYADSDGYESDDDRPTAYHFRDFVINALNDDMPFDQFVREQLAGDEIKPDDPQAIAATGFLAAGPSAPLPDNLLEEERVRQRYNELDDMVTTTGAAFLGLTLGCARCHDHKFDPVPTRDYYRILAALSSGDRAETPLGTRAEVDANKKARAEWEKKREAAEGRLKEWLGQQKHALEPELRRQKIDRLPIKDTERAVLREKPDSAEAKALAKEHAKALDISNAEFRGAMDDAAGKRWDELEAELKVIREHMPKTLPLALAFRDRAAKPAASWLFARGDFNDRSTPVELGFLTVLTRGRPAADYWKDARAGGDRTDTTYQRRALAAWITDIENGAGPLLARVIVNRVWQHHFGEGLVTTPNDFGTRADPPSNPALLEWLASDLVSHGWKLKRLHRMILLSAAYQRSTTFDAANAKVDPDNRLLWRMRPRRLEAESLRDAMLAVSGTLNPRIHGPAFRSPIPADAMVARNLKTPYPADVRDDAASHCRSVYMFHKRVIPFPLFQAFDAPDAQQCAGRRNVTTVAPQALAMLNGPFVRARAADFAERLRKDAGDDPAKQVDRAFLLAFARPPSAVERDAGIDFLAQQRKGRAEREPKAAASDIERSALTDYAQALFGLNEFIYVD